MSEVVAFILTFSIITTMVGVLYTAGFASLDVLQTGTQMQNAEGVFIAMADSIGELQEGQAPKRAGALDLDVGASLTIRNRSTIDVEVNGAGFSRTLVLGSLEYTLDDRAVTYESGAVFRTDREASAMIGDPPAIFCSPDQQVAMVSIVSIRAPGTASVASGTATVTGIQRSSTLLFPDDRTSPAIENVTVTVSSPKAEAWNRHFERASGWSDSDGDGTFACEAVDRVYVRQTIVDIRLG